MIAALALCALSASAATLTPSESAALGSISANSLRGHLSFLASDLLEGRGTPSRGQDLAAEYIAAQYRRAGLEPLGDDEYFQTASWNFSEPDLSGLAFTLQSGPQRLALAPKQLSFEPGAALDAKSVALSEGVSVAAAALVAHRAMAAIIVFIGSFAKVGVGRKLLQEIQAVSMPTSPPQMHRGRVHPLSSGLPRPQLARALLRRRQIAMNYCSLISTSTPAGRSSFISASTVLSVGSTMSIRRWWVRISN